MLSIMSAIWKNERLRDPWSGSNARLIGLVMNAVTCRKRVLLAPSAVVASSGWNPQ